MSEETESKEPLSTDEVQILDIMEDPQMLLGQIRHFANQCCKLLEEGQEVDVTGLDAQVQKLCTRVNAMPVEEAMKLRPKMDSLIEELDALSEALENQKALIKAQLNDLVRQQKAHVAYQTADASAPRSEEN